jgi:hypothetical protein
MRDCPEKRVRWAFETTAFKDQGGLKQGQYYPEFF